MLFKPICEIKMRYQGETVWIAPYGEKEKSGYGSGSGTVSGKVLNGTINWSNHPRRREDGVWCPDINGFITTDDGARILAAIMGYSILEKPPGVKRSIVAAVWFQVASDDERYRWLNYVIGIGEGEIDEETEEFWMRVSACLNEVSSNPSAILGAQEAAERLT